MTGKKFLFFSYGIVLILLFLYSYTQVDLSLTFSRLGILHSLVNAFQYIGYFQRPLSAGIYVSLLILLFVFYVFFLCLSYKGFLNKKDVWKLILGGSILLVFSYNAFSYDLFNYIFDAKIVTHYHQNPYLHKALDYQGDPMLSFMRWTHRVYPYGPLWLVLTVPLSFIGYQFFIPTFFFFKLLMTASFVGSVYLIGKIFQRLNPRREVLGIVFFGLQPLLLIESLVSSHLDIVMMFFALYAIYLLLEKRYMYSLMSFFLSIGIKFATLFIAPLFIFFFICENQKKVFPWRLGFFLTTVLMLVATIIASVRTNFQPWYLIGPLTFAVFLADWVYILVITIIISFFALLSYLPFLYLGNWNPPVPQLLSVLYTTSYILSGMAIVGFIVTSLVRKKR